MNLRLTALAVLALGMLAASPQAAAQQEHWHTYNQAYWTDAQARVHPEHQYALRKADAWQDFLDAHGSWYVAFNESTGFPHRASGPAIATEGADPQARALHFLTETLAAYDLPLDDLRLTRVYEGERFTYVDFEQMHEGLRVLDSRVTLRLTQDGRVVLFGIDLHPEMEVDLSASASPAGIMSAANTGMPTPLSHIDVDAERYILPVPSAEGLDYRVVHRAMAEFEPVNGVPGQFEILVDAASGELVSRKAKVFECAHHVSEHAHAAKPVMADITVEGGIVDNPALAPVTRGLPYVRVTVAGTDYFADEDGVVNIASITSPTSATVHLDGRWADVVVGASGTVSSNFTTTVTPGANTINFDGSALPQELAAYYHTNVIHDFMKGFFPAFTDLDYPFTVKVDRTDGSCNAFYNGSSINFYANGGGCPATAFFSDVVYHEYGHGLNNDVYAFFGDTYGFPGMDNGGLNEGYADVWGLSISFNPILGDGFSGPGSDVRRYDIDPKRYPEDLVGQVHADGEIIAGAWWDYGVEMGDPQEMVDLFTKAYPAAIDGPDGDEGSVYRDILLEALIQDDDDADLSNGTPNDDEILTAFGIHGITLLANVEVEHTETAQLAATPVTIEAELDIDFSIYLGDFNIVWRPQGSSSWSTAPMGLVSGPEYRVDLPAQAAGTILEYYFEVFDNFGTKAITQPSRADQLPDPNLPYYALVGFVQAELYDFDVEFGDWELDPEGTDDASTGQWEFASPQTSTVQGYVNQSGQDYSPGTTSNLCAVTGRTGYTSSSSSNWDVDDGETTLQSPEFNASQYDDPVFAYWRWFSNDPPSSANPGNDPWEVYITNDGVNWTKIRNTFTSDASWRRDVIRISDYLPTTSTVSLRFVASDRFVPGAPSDGGSLVEAMVDDLALYGIGVEDTTSTSGIEILDPSTVELFPNPTQGAFQMRWDAAWTAEWIGIYDAMGREVYSTGVARATNAVRIPDLNLADGLYSVRLRTDDQRLVQRSVLLQH